MTRPKADTDPWLTDPVSRDREVSKSVVYGLRTITSLLRGIRDDSVLTQQSMQREIRELRQEVIDLWQANADMRGKQPARRTDFEACPEGVCSLPGGHQGNHRASIRRAI